MTRHRTSSRTAAILLALSGLASLTAHAHATVGDFRVLPYQQSPTTGGALRVWAGSAD